MERVDIAGTITLHDCSTLVLDDYSAGNANASNLRRRSADGLTIWSAPLTETTLAAYVSVESDGEHIFANSFNCFCVRLAFDDGRILDKVFTK